MRTFEQYIEESVDFRLGGSKNKGAADKTFGELKKGDVFYRYSIDISSRRFTKNPCKCIFECIDGIKMRYFFDDRNSNIARFTMFVDKDKSMASHTYGVTAGRGLYYVYSTIEYDKATIIEKIVELSKKADKDGNVYESVDFRLGGSTNRGDVSKSFNELEKGDKIYFYKFDGFDIESFCSDTFTFDKLPFINSDYASLQYSTKSGDKFWFKVPMSDIEKDCTVNFSEFNKHMRSYVFSTYKMTTKEALDVAKERKERLKESVDFRLGGKAGKGEAPKTLDELEAGDTYYIWEYEFNFKLVYKDERNVTTVTRDETAIMICFESMGEGRSMNRFERKYADDDTMLIMSGTRFYFYATHDMTDEEVVKKIKEKRDSKNYKMW